MAEDKPPPERRTITLGEASALLGVLAVGVYVLGLLALWVPLSRTYTGDYSTSWYAVSLIPRTTVIGQGMVLLAAPLLATLAAALFTVVINLLEHVAIHMADVLTERFLEDRRHREQATGMAHLFIIPVVAAAYVYLVIRYIFAPVVVGILQPDSLGWTFLLGFVLSLPGGLVVFLALRLQKTRAVQVNASRWLPEVVNARRLRRIAIFGLTLAFVVAFILAVTSGEPPLPTVQLTANTSVEGKLLTHVDRFWYVFDEHGTLVAVPDEEITEVRISS